ncbi:MAG: DUF748 domain-containing protein [Verrucomicrobiota bacterium]
MSEARGSSRRWLKRGLLIVTILYGIYIVFGFFVLPRIIKSVAEGQVAETLDRKVVLERSSFNPFTLRLELGGLRVEDDKGESLIELGAAVVNVQVVSAFLMEPVLKEFSLKDVVARLAIDEEGKTNVERLLSMSGGESTESSEEGEFGFALELLKLENVSLAFADRSLAKPFEEVVGPIDLEAKDLEFKPDGDSSPHRFAAKIGEQTTIEWEGDATLVPLASKGRFALRDLQVGKGEPYWREFAEVAAEGLVSLELDYEAFLREEQMAMTSDHLALSLKDFSAGMDEGDDLAVAVPLFEVTASVDTFDREVVVKSVVGRDIVLRATRAENGSLILPAMAPTEASDAEEHEVPEAAPAWTISGGDVEIGVSSMVLVDRSLEDESHVELLDTALYSDEFDWDREGGSLGLGVASRIGDEGRLGLEADLDLASLDIEFETSIENLNIADFAGYIKSVSNADLKNALFSFEAEGEVGAEGDLALAFEGSVSGFDLGVLNEQGSVSQFEAFGVEGGSFDGEKLEIGRLKLTQPAFNASMDGRGVNLLRLVMDPEGEVKEIVEEAVESDMEEASELPLAFSINEIVVEEGRIEFLDKTLDDAFSSLVSNLNFKTTGVTSNLEGSPATIEMLANIDSGSNLSLEGEVLALDPEENSDMTLSLKGYDLTATSPYWRKFLGRDIEKGQLFIDGSYEMQGKQLKALNNVRIKGLELGEKVQSEDSLGLPIGLAVALLSDRQGNLELRNIEVSGSLDEPGVGTGSLIAQALGIALRNVIAKAATAPFSLLGSLAGGKKDLDTVAFMTSNYRLSEEATAKLDDMAKIMQERPLLKIEIESRMDRAGELAGFVEPLRDFKLQELLGGSSQGSDSIDPLALLRDFDRERYERNLGAAFRENQLYGSVEEAEGRTSTSGTVVDQFASLLGLQGRESNSGNLAVAAIGSVVKKELSKSGALDQLKASLEQMTQWLESAQPEWKVDESWLNALADERAKSARRYLLEEKAISPERVFIKNVAAKDAKESFLKLTPVN